MSPEVLAMLALLDPHNAVVHQPNAPRIALHFTGDETPSELSMFRLYSHDLPTSAVGGYRVSEPLVELFNAAYRHVTNVAVLPGDPAADQIVERLIRARNAGKRPLVRK
jgi:hypothetical protein